MYEPALINIVDRIKLQSWWCLIKCFDYNFITVWNSLSINKVQVKMNYKHWRLQSVLSASTESRQSQLIISF